jgi:Flp pilus assembly protein TadB
VANGGAGVVMVAGTLAAVVAVAATTLGGLAVRPRAVSAVLWERRLVWPRRCAAGSPGGAVGVADMVRVLDAVSRSLRAGAGVAESLRAATAVGGVHAADLAVVTGMVDAGVGLSVAVGAWRDRRPTPVVALATAVLTFGVHTGSSVARAVDGAAATLRERLALMGEVRVMASQARASALVVGAAPVVFTAVVAVADPRVAVFLFTNPAGWVCVVVGGGLEVGCVAWMRSLVARASEL